MSKINFLDHKGETRTVDVENGATVMEAAIRNAVPGIEAECGGACACATCHVYVDEAWQEKVGYAWRSGVATMSPSSSSLTLIWHDSRELGRTSKPKSSMSSSIGEGGPTFSRQASST